MEKLVFEHKKNCINVYGDALYPSGEKLWVRLGKIEFNSKCNTYCFVPRFILRTIGPSTMQKIVDKMQQLYKKNKAKIDANEVELE